MSAINAIIILAVFGAAVWAIVTYIPLQPKIKQVIIIVSIICAVAWVLSITGILSDAKAIKVPKLN